MISSKAYFQISGCLFAIVGFFHLYRALMNLTLTLGTFEFPVWLSYVAGLFLWYLSYNAFKLSGKKR